MPQQPALAQSGARARHALTGSGADWPRSKSGSGTLISFSTQPGNVALDGTGRNSPFASALVKQVASSSDDLGVVLIQVRNDVMNATQRKQVPWEHSAMTGRFYFKPPDLNAGPPAIAKGRLSEASEAWGATKETKDVALLERFIARYKEAFYAQLASSRIDACKRVELAAASAAPRRSAPPQRRRATNSPPPTTTTRRATSPFTSRTCVAPTRCPLAEMP